MHSLQTLEKTILQSLRNHFSDCELHLALTAQSLPQSTSRVDQSIYAKEALQQAIETLPSIPRFLKIESSPILSSTAHTLSSESGWAIAAALRHIPHSPETASSRSILGIGIDIEWSERKIAEDKLKERITTPQEAKLYWPTLPLWCIKEACFKATPENSNHFTSQFQILTPPSPQMHRLTGTRAEIEYWSWLQNTPFTPEWSGWVAVSIAVSTL